MTREWIDERHYKILHNKYENGKFVEQFYRYYTENETKTHIYLHPEIIMSNQSGKGTASGKFDGYDKIVVLECEDLGFVGDNCPELKGYNMEHDGEEVKCVFHCKDGKDIEIISHDGGESLELA